LKPIAENSWRIDEGAIDDLHQVYNHPYYEHNVSLVNTYNIREPTGHVLNPQPTTQLRGTGFNKLDGYEFLSP
jgi:hypothetical protein